jgi:polyisoprenyl-phosphate glycosyltransferase
MYASGLGEGGAAGMPAMSVVVPVYQAGGCLVELHRRLVAALSKLSDAFEIILVDDGSTDGSWQIICDLAAHDTSVKGICLTRNFGQHFAITAGLEHCRGDWVVVMDCDLQDQPEEIERLRAKAREGYDIVFARRKTRQDSAVKRATSTFFFCLYNYFTETHTDSSTANFGIYSRKVVTAYLRMREHSRSFGLFVRWLGYPAASIDVEHAPRYSGTTSYSLPKLAHLAVDLIITQTNKPLRLFVQLGFAISLISFLFGLYNFVMYFFLDVPMGWTSIIVSLFFVGGLNMLGLGVLGLYVGKIFDETKNRPLYVIRSARNLDVGL